MAPNLKLVLAVVLSIVAWELLKYAMKGMLSIAYYRKEGGVVIRVKVMPWDLKGRKHFEEQGYTQNLLDLEE